MEANSQGQISLVFKSDRRKEWSEELSKEVISELTCVRVGCWSGEDGGGVQAGETQGMWLATAQGQKAELTWAPTVCWVLSWAQASWGSLGLPHPPSLGGT